MKGNYYLEVIRAAIVYNGFEFNPEDSVMDIFQRAYDNLMDKPAGKTFIRTDLNGHGMSQSYTFYDSDTEFSNLISGDIFDFNWHYKAKDEVLFREKGNGEFEPVDWFEIPMDGEPDRDKYVFVFDKQILSDGNIAYLYDHFR